MTLPKALNETKSSRSFYQDDENTSFSPILETSAAQKPSEEEPSKIVSQFVDGHKIKTSSYLESNLNTVRNIVIDQLNYADAEYRNLTSATLNEWRNLSEGLTSVYDPKDEFLPNFMYALTTALVGSILVNQKSLPVRFIAPVTFGIAGFKLFLPNTFTNTVKSIRNYEAKEYPELLQYQRSLKQSVIETEQSIERLNADAQQSLIQTIHDIRESITK